MRHRIVEAVRAEGLDVEVLGRGYAPFEAKEDGLAPFEFSVVIENSREPGYISEKLLDACLCRTIPVYWGAPDVADYLDPAGLVICETEEALLTALRDLQDPKTLAQAIDTNQKTARELAEGPLRATLALAADLSPPAPPAIETERLRLRPYHIGDTAALHRFFRDPEAMQYWATPHRKLAETAAIVQMTIHADPATTCDYVIEMDGQIVGKAGMWQRPEIGFFILPEYQRQGIATEALQALIPHLFARFEIDALTADVDPRNAACLALLDRLGFRETHRAERTIQIDGQWCDSVYLSVPRSRVRNV